ncbi:MAG: apolipoprotein N-acyltransferase [Oceanospirillales bacterium]|nr:MAG: apolipoprotein N-acyltransferase [Oceanospirillales bacterium]
MLNSLAAKCLFAVIAGALMVLAFSPFDLFPFILLGPAVLFWLLNDLKSSRQAALIGWGFGFGLFGAGVSWVWVSIHVYGGASVLIATLATLLFVAALGLLFSAQAWIFYRFFIDKPNAWLAFIAIWMGFEWLRSWFLTGFPWLLTGYAWLDTPFSPLGSLMGVWGLSLLTLCISIGIFQAVKQRALAPLFVAALLPIIALITPKTWTQTVPDSELSVALVQPNISQHDKWDRRLLAPMLQHLINLSLPYQDHDLIVWPETAIPSLYYQAAPYTEPFFNRLENQQTTLISGFPYMTSDSKNPELNRFHNSLGIFSYGQGVYHKQRLVPFGEYVPLEAQLRGLIDFFDLPMSEFSLPEHTELTLDVKGRKIAPLICYEIAYPELTRRSSEMADMILTVSNDAWFDDSLAAEQHLQIARMRAVENGRWLLRGTNDGITALVAPNGDIVDRLSREQAGVLSVKVPSMQGQTPYQRFGLWPAMLLSLLLLGFSFWPRPR